MVISAIKTMTQKVKWSDRDVIIIDMPPGTGDTQLTFVQEIKVDGAIIVSTPQDLALLDVKRGIQMFEKTGIKLILPPNRDVKKSPNTKFKHSIVASPAFLGPRTGLTTT